MSPESGSQDETLDRFWDAIVLGEAGSQEGIDPMDAAALRYLHHHGRLPALDPAYRRSLRRALLGAPSLPVSTSPSAFTVGDDGTVAPGRLAPAREPDSRARGSWRRWTAAQLATAALVLMTLLAGYVAFGLQHRHEETALVSIPAIVGTPETSPAADFIEDTVLAQQRFDVVPPYAIWTGIERYTFAPGETWPQGTTPGAGYGPMLYRVENGTMTVRAEAPFVLTRAASGASEAAPQETDVVLQPGDVAYLPFDVGSVWRNDGTGPAQVMDTGIAAVSDWSPKDVDSDFNYDAYPIAPPDAPVQFTLRRLIIAPGASLPNVQSPGVCLMGVETGSLTLVPAIPASVDATPETRVLETPVMNGSPNMLDLNDARHPVQALRNDSAEPVRIFLLTIAPLPASGSRGATPMP